MHWLTRLTGTFQHPHFLMAHGPAYGRFSAMTGQNISTIEVAPARRSE
jgi:hypothetical protein